jgi:zinc protease
MKRAALGIAFALACGSPPEEPREYPPLPGTEGGEDVGAAVEREPLRVEPAVLVRRSSSPLVTFRVVFDAGSASDEAGREGLTLVTARTMVEGGAGDLSYAELSQRLYPMAASLDAQVGRDQTVFMGQVHRDHLEAFYDLFRDVLLRPRMGEADFARIREQVRTALAVDLRNADDEELGKEALHALIYGGHPYGHPPLGTEAGLERMRVDDARAHRNRVFCAGRATVGISGDVPSGFEERVVRDVAALRSEACIGREGLPAVESVDSPRVLIVHKPDAQAVAVSMGFPIAVRRDHPDYPALFLASAWLGQHRQFVGRLMQAIRGQRGLNYGDYAYAEHFTQEGWTRFPMPNDARRQQYFSIWLRPLRPETAHFAIRLAVRELRRMVEQGISAPELDRIRTFADRYLALYLQTESRRLGFAIDDAFYGAEGEYVARLREAWTSMSAETLNDAIRRHLTPERLQIAIVASDAEELATAIATEAESPVTYRSTVPESVLAEDREIVGYRLGIARDRIRIVPHDEMFAR